MSKYNNVPTWGALTRKAVELENSNVSNYNSQYGTKYKKLSSIIEALYGNLFVTEGFGNRMTLYDIIQKDIDSNEFEEIITKPIEQIDLFGGSKVIKAGNLTTTQQYNGEDFGFKDEKLADKIGRAAKRYFDARVIEIEKQNGMKIDVNYKRNMSVASGAILELTFQDTLSEVYGKENLMVPKRVNSPYDFSIFDLPMESKLGLDNFRYMDKAPSRVPIDIIKGMRSQAMQYYKTGSFNEEEYKNAFVRGLINYKLEESAGATFVTGQGASIAYLLASDFIKDLASVNGEYILNHERTVLNMDDIYDILKEIKENVKNQIVEPITYKRNRSSSLWYAHPGQHGTKIRAGAKGKNIAQQSLFV